MQVLTKNLRVAIIGLGYVGLPLAVEFGKRYPTLGFDINTRRIAELKDGVDHTLETDAEELATALHLSYTTDAEDLRASTVFIVTVPTPIDDHKQPDLTPLRLASEVLGKVIKLGDVAVFESTVYPGATEEYCVPIIEQVSGLVYNRDFYIGYSPERINPGDKAHRLTTITKVTSGSTPEAADFVDALYSSIIEAGTHKAASIRVAEAAKVIENTQRDLNIALMNELAIIFNKMGIDTEDVLKAAGTKWNFLPFRPGLVGGHCIGVDPYYLTHKAESLGYHPQVILAGRRINDNMAKFVAEKTVKELIARDCHIKGAKVNVLGLTFKENCPDLRNSKVADLIMELQSYGLRVHVHDPVADPAAAQHEYGISLDSWDALPQADGLVLAVPHRELAALGLADVMAKLKPGGCFIDIKSQFHAESLREAGFRVWRL